MTEEIGMDELLAQSESVKPDSVVEGVVIGQTEAYLLVDIGLKQEALLSIKELGSTLPASGTKITVLVLRLNGPEGRPLVSFRQAREKQHWDRLVASFKSQEIVEGRVTEKVKGGFRVDVGMDAFMPMSQWDNHPAANPADCVGKKIQVMILEMDRSKGNVLVSRRRVQDQDKAKKRQALLGSISVGQVFKGRVTGLTKFGAFIDIGGVEGMVHITDLAWIRVNDPKTVVKVGDEIEVKVLKFDPASKRISLGRKQLLPHPWEGIETRFPVGGLFKGKVTSLADFGAFVELEPGVEGLVHVSEMSWTERINNPKTFLKTGQAVDIKVTDIDKAKEKISLSLKRTGPSPWDKAADQFKAGCLVEGKITSVAPFGAFVKVSVGVEALLRTQDVSWTEKISSAKNYFKVGDKVSAVVLEVIPAQEKMAIGIKQLTPDPLKRLRVGAGVSGKVQKVLGSGLLVRLDSGLEGFVPAKELRLDHSIFKERDRDRDRDRTMVEKDLKEFKEGDPIDASVTKINKKDRKIDLSVRRYEKDQERELLKKYSGNNDKLTLGQTTGWSKSEETKPAE